jgi:hypothetical protein
MPKGRFNQSFRFVPKISGVEHDQSRRVIIEDGKPSYSEQAACVVLGAELVKLRRLHQEGLIRSEVPDEFTEAELRTLHGEVRELRAEGVVIE